MQSSISFSHRCPWIRIRDYKLSSAVRREKHYKNTHPDAPGDEAPGEGRRRGAGEVRPARGLGLRLGLLHEDRMGLDSKMLYASHGTGAVGKLS